MKIKPNSYSYSLTKVILNYFLTIILIIILFPLSIFISSLIKLTSNGPILFTQKRTGKDNQPFKIYKFRTMHPDSHQLQKKYQHLNFADGPVFKARNDPRFTSFGKILSKTGLDELPQLFNVLRGNMNLVGPRPLPIQEANQLTANQKLRHLIKPGITSTWVAKGPHSVSFNQWMNMDLDYLQNASLKKDLTILYQTCFYIFTLIHNRLKSLFHHKTN